MYSGITAGLFKISFIEKRPGLTIYKVRLNPLLLKNLTIGASVAVDGVCQTVVAIEKNDVTFQAIEETLTRTTLSSLDVNRWVSVERSICYGDEIGGHEVAGHVIGTATIVATASSENNLTLTLKCSSDWMEYIFPKGFIAIDGSSLTVGEINLQENTFQIHLIPETLRLTNFGNKKVGDQVNIELDHRTQVLVETAKRIMTHIPSTRV